MSTPANGSDLQSFCSQTILSPPSLQFQGQFMEKIEVLFLAIEGFEAFALVSLPALQTHLKTKTFQRVKNALRNEVKCRRISLTSISIYWISFA